MEAGSQSRVEPMHHARSGGLAEDESPLPLGALACVLVLGSMVLFLFGDSLGNPVYAGAVTFISLVTCIVGVAIGLAGSRRTAAAQWAAIAMLIALALGSAAWLRMPSILGLSAIPIIIAGLTRSANAAAIVAAVETPAVLWLSSRTGADPDATGIAVVLATNWSIVAALLLIHRFVHSRDGWLSAQYQASHRAMESARDDKLGMEEGKRALANANRQLLLANKRAAILRRLAESSEQAKRMFVSKVSHEFRTPLNMVIGLVDLVMSEYAAGRNHLPPQLHKDLQVVHRNCVHLSDMIDDVLSLSQVESGRLTLQKERVDVAEMVRDALVIVRPLVHMKGVALEACLPDGLPAVYCDRTRIQQVILNLVSNAGRFTDSGKIVVAAEGHDGHIRVSVTDTGPGISPEDVSRIFEPFAQGGQEIQRQRGGSGLGLCISRQFVRLHGGRMWLESQLGAGSSFTFELPISPPMAPASAAGDWIRADWEWKEAAFTSGRQRGIDADGKPHALVVDSTGRLSSELDRFTDLADFDHVPDWARARERLEEGPTNTVIINAESPERLLALADRARVDAPWTPIIGCVMPPSAQHALQVGAIDHLVKPVLAEDLFEVLDRLPVGAKRVLVVDDDADFVSMLVRMLRARGPGLEVSTASNGEEALALLRRQPVDLVFLDVMLPDMTGWQVLAAKQEEHLAPDAPVAIVSAQDPGAEPSTTPWVLGAVGQGLSVSQFLRCALRLPDVLMSLDRQPHSAPGRTVGA